MKFQAILSKAAELFNWQGSRATTLEDIASGMDLTKTCIYYYVKTKEDLIYHCYVASCDMWLTRAQQVANGTGNGLQKIVAMVRGHLEQHLDTLNGKAPHFAVLTEVSSLNKIHAADIKQRWMEIFNQCNAMVKQGIKEAVIEDLNPALVSLGIFSVIQWFPVWLNRSHAADPQPVIEGVLDILTQGLSAERHHFADIDFPQLKKWAVDSFDRDYQSHIKRQAFYRAGSIYFNQKGYKGTSLDEIATSLGVTKGAFYYHIKNKEELLYQCFKRTLEIENALLSRAGCMDGTGLKKLALSLRYLFNVQFSDQGPLIRYRALPSLDEAHRKLILKGTKANNAILGAYLLQGFDDNTIRKVNVGVAQNMLSGAIEASADLTDWVASDTDEEELSAAYFNLFINGLLRRRVQ